jgi:hypothetical protein
MLKAKGLNLNMPSLLDAKCIIRVSMEELGSTIEGERFYSGYMTIKNRSSVS